MSSSDYRKRLRDVINNIEAVLEYVGTAGFEAFASDRRSVDATERCLERIAEAVVKIGPEQFAAIDTVVPFERVRGLGNMLRHAYDVIDERLIFNLAIQELPRLRNSCVVALESR